MAFAGENSHGGVGIFVPCRVPEDLILPPQKVCKADLLRPVFDERAYAVLPRHAPGKGHGHTARVDPEQPVQPPVLRLHLCKRPHPHRLRFCIHDSTAGAVFHLSFWRKSRYTGYQNEKGGFSYVFTDVS